MGTSGSKNDKDEQNATNSRLPRKTFSAPTKRHHSTIHVENRPHSSNELDKDIRKLQEQPKLAFCDIPEERSEGSYSIFNVQTDREMIDQKKEEYDDHSLETPRPTEDKISLTDKETTKTNDYSGIDQKKEEYDDHSLETPRPTEDKVSLTDKETTKTNDYSGVKSQVKQSTKRHKKKKKRIFGIGKNKHDGEGENSQITTEADTAHSPNTNETLDDQATATQDKQNSCAASTINVTSNYSEGNDDLDCGTLNLNTKENTMEFKSDKIIEEEQIGEDEKELASSTSSNRQSPKKEKRKGEKGKKASKQSDTQNNIMRVLVSDLAAFCQSNCDDGPRADTDKLSEFEDLREFVDQISKIEDHIRKQNKELLKSRYESDGYMNRLSKIAGDNLTVNNPNITNLNDDKRPTKLAEEFKSLYDNEWTDVMEIMDNSKEKHKTSSVCVVHIFAVLKAVYLFCKKKADIQLHGLLSHLLLLNDPSEIQKNESMKYSTERQLITDYRKSSASKTIKKFKKTIGDDACFKDELFQLQNRDDVIIMKIQKSPFFEKCIELCWRFVIQDPPLFLDINSMHGRVLKRDLYSEYTRAGTVIEYVVWPVLYLHEGGPILAKGVAQPYREEKNVSSKKEGQTRRKENSMSSKEEAQPQRGEKR